MKIQKHPNQPQPLKWLLVFHALFNFHDFLQTATAAAVSLNLQQKQNQDQDEVTQIQLLFVFLSSPMLPAACGHFEQHE